MIANTASLIKRGLISADAATKKGLAKKSSIHDAFSSGKKGAYAVDKHELTPAETIAIAAYKNGEYKELNAVLRGERSADAEIQGYIDNLIRAFDHAKSTQSGVVYRGVHDLTPGNFKTGSVIQFKGFTSTSTSKEFAESWGGGGVLFQIYVPKNSKAMEYAKVSGYHDKEYEVILKAGMKFTVAGVSGNVVSLAVLVHTGC